MGRGSVNRQVQVGVESTPGTPVAANKLLPSTNFVLSPEIENRDFRAQGWKVPTTTKIVGFDGGGTVSSPLNYTEIIYLLNMIVTGVITTPGGGTLSRTHTFAPTATGTDAFKTLTVQEGDATAATQMAHIFLPELSVTATDDAAEVAGTIVGYAPTVTTLTATPTAIAQQPIGPRELDVYIDSTVGAIGTTKITDALGYNFNVSALRQKKRVLNTTYQSFKDTTDTPVELSAGFTTEHNLQSRNIYAAQTVTSSPTYFVRLKATGAIIEGAIPYSLSVDCAARIVDMNQQDVNSVWGFEYALQPIYDSTFGNKMFEIAVTNNITAL